MENKLIGIYKIVNTINSKIYIGKSQDDIEKRFQQHLRRLINDTHYNKHLQRSFNKYGAENFKLEILEIIYDKFLFNEREKYWINYYNSSNIQYGYNLTFGGDGGSPNEDVRKKISKTMKNHKRTEQHCENLRKSLKNNKKLYGNENHNSKPVIQSDIHTKFIARYESGVEASKITGINASMISASCTKHTIIRKKFRFFFEKDYDEDATNNINDQIKISTIKKTTGTKYIVWRKDKKKWGVQVYIGKGIKKFLGFFNNIEDAKIKRDLFIEEMHRPVGDV